MDMLQLLRFMCQNEANHKYLLLTFPEMTQIPKLFLKELSDDHNSSGK